MFRLFLFTILAGLIGSSMGPRLAGASESGDSCPESLEASPSFDARIRDELVEHERVLVRIFFKPSIDLDVLPSEERALLMELEHANPGCTRRPGFVSQLQLHKLLNALGGAARLSFMDASPNPLAEVNRVTFEAMVRSSGPWIDRIEFATSPDAIVQ